MPLRVALAVAVAATVGLGLAGCDVPDPAPTVEPIGGAPSPTPSAGPVVDRPEPVIGATCEELAPAASVAAAMPAGVVARDAAAGELSARPQAIASAYIVRSLGGIACEWNNGESYSDRTGANPDYRGVKVLVLPNAASQWAHFEEIYTGTGAVGQYCAELTTPLYCSTNALVGSNWVEVTVIGPNSAATAATLSETIVAAVSAAGPGAAPWTAPAGTLAMTANCEDALPVTPVGILLGVGVPLVTETAAGGWSLDAGARENAGVAACYYAFEGSMAGVATFDSIPAGAWAWHEARALITTPTAPESVDLDFLGTGDEAWVRCTAAVDTCYLDLVVGNNWIELTAFNTEGDGAAATVTEDVRAGILRMGEAILGELRG